MRDTVEPCPLLVVGSQDVPRRIFSICSVEHHVACTGVVVPAAARGQVDRTQLPLPQGVIQTGFEAPTLLVVTDFEPVLDQVNSTRDDILLHYRHRFRNSLCCSSVQNPMTYSTPARLYQLQSKITISPALGSATRSAVHRFGSSRGRMEPEAPRPGRLER